MTVGELESRLDMSELHEWAVVARLERQEREQDERIDRVRRNAQANRKG